MQAKENGGRKCSLPTAHWLFLVSYNTAMNRCVHIWPFHQRLVCVRPMPCFHAVDERGDIMKISVLIPQHALQRFNSKLMFLVDSICVYRVVYTEPDGEGGGLRTPDCSCEQILALGTGHLGWWLLTNLGLRLRLRMEFCAQFQSQTQEWWLSKSWDCFRAQAWA